MDKKNQTLKPDDKNQSLGPTRARHNSTPNTEQETDKKITWKIVRTNQPGEHSADWRNNRDSLSKVEGKNQF